LGLQMCLGNSFLSFNNSAFAFGFCKHPCPTLTCGTVPGPSWPSTQAAAGGSISGKRKREDGEGPSEEDDPEDGDHGHGGVAARTQGTSKRRKGDGGLICRACDESSLAKEWGEHKYIKDKNNRLVKVKTGDFCQEDKDVKDWAFPKHTLNQIAENRKLPGKKGELWEKDMKKARRIKRGLARRNFTPKEVAKKTDFGIRYEQRVKVKTERYFSNRGVTRESLSTELTTYTVTDGRGRPSWCVAKEDPEQEEDAVLVYYSDTKISKAELVCELARNLRDMQGDEAVDVEREKHRRKARTHTTDHIEQAVTLALSSLKTKKDRASLKEAERMAVEAENERKRFEEARSRGDAENLLSGDDSAGSAHTGELPSSADDLEIVEDRKEKGKRGRKKTAAPKVNTLHRGFNPAPRRFESLCSSSGFMMSEWSGGVTHLTGHSTENHVARFPLPRSPPHCLLPYLFVPPGRSLLGLDAWRERKKVKSEVGDKVQQARTPGSGGRSQGAAASSASGKKPGRPLGPLAVKEEKGRSDSEERPAELKDTSRRKKKGSQMEREEDAEADDEEESDDAEDEEDTDEHGNPKPRTDITACLTENSEKLAYRNAPIGLGKSKKLRWVIIRILPYIQPECYWAKSAYKHNQQAIRYRNQANTTGMTKLGKKITFAFDLQDIAKKVTAGKVKTAAKFATSVSDLKELIAQKNSLIIPLEHKSAFVLRMVSDLFADGKYDEAFERLKNYLPAGEERMAFNFEDPYLKTFYFVFRDNGTGLIDDAVTPVLKDLFEKGELGVPNAMRIMVQCLWNVSETAVGNVSNIAVAIHDMDFSLSDEVNALIRDKHSKSWLRKHLITKDSPWQRRVAAYLEKASPQ
jgi:hypothetical protein